MKCARLGARSRLRNQCWAAYHEATPKAQQATAAFQQVMSQFGEALNCFAFFFVVSLIGHVLRVEDAAQFIGTTPAERHEIFKGVKDMYGRRSALFHGTYDLEKYNNGTFVTTAELDKWASWIRRGISGFLALYLGGEKDRDAILSMIAAAGFDSTVAERLRSSCSLRKVLEEQVHPSS